MVVAQMGLFEETSLSHWNIIKLGHYADTSRNKLHQPIKIILGVHFL
jgi:hypothetical protein